MSLCIVIVWWSLSQLDVWFDLHRFDLHLSNRRSDGLAGSPVWKRQFFNFFPSHLIVRHFIHFIHFILFTSLKSKHPVRRCLGTCLTHSKTGRRDWNIRVHSFSLISFSLISCSFTSVSFTSFSFTSFSFTSFFFISFTNTKRLEKKQNNSLVGVVVVGADGWWELMEHHLDFTNLFSTATTNQSTSNNNNNNHIQIGSTLYCVWVFKKNSDLPHKVCCGSLGDCLAQSVQESQRSALLMVWKSG